MLKFYYCELCGNVVEKLVDKGTPLSCCGQEMVELTANTSDGAGEKHVPAVKIEGNKVRVQIGEVVHPMIQEHYIQFIVVETDKRIYRQNLVPDELPVAKFILEDDEVVKTVYEYCNIHGLWKIDL